MELQYRGSGKAYYNKKNYQCDLYYNEDLGGIILKINVKNKNAIGSFLEVPLELKYLCGQLDSGFRFTLLQLTRVDMKDLVSYGKSIYTFSAKYILCGIGKKNQAEQTFYKVKYRLANIIEWGEESVYKIGEDYNLISKNVDIRKTIYNEKGVCINYVVRGETFPFVEKELLQERVEISQFGWIEIELKKEETLEKFNDIFVKIKGLFEIASLRKINIEKVNAYSHEICEKIGSSTFERPIDIYGENIKKNTLESLAKNRWWKWIRLSELIERNSFLHYFNKHEKLAPIIELFLEPFSANNMSKVRVFLNLVQALETYHSRFITNDIKVFKSNIEKLVEGQSVTRADEIRKFLMANSKGFITLESRIADLMLADWKIYFDTGEIKHTDFPEVVASTRNYYVHYDESIKKKHRVLSEEELQLYNRTLIKILEYYILLEIGFTIEVNNLKKKLEDRWGNVSRDLEILRISKSQHNMQS